MSGSVAVEKAASWNAPGEDPACDAAAAAAPDDAELLWVVVAVALLHASNVCLPVVAAGWSGLSVVAAAAAAAAGWLSSRSPPICGHAMCSGTRARRSALHESEGGAAALAALAAGGGGGGGGADATSWMHEEAARALSPSSLPLLMGWDGARCGWLADSPALLTRVLCSSRRVASFASCW